MNDAPTGFSTFDTDDRRTALAVIAEENVKRAAAVPPLPDLPSSTPQEMRNSYQIIMAARLQQAHLANIAAFKAKQQANASVRQIRDAAMVATDAQRAAALTALTT